MTKTRQYQKLPLEFHPVLLPSSMMTMKMMARMMEPNESIPAQEKRSNSSPEAPNAVYLKKRRPSEDSRDLEMCEKASESDEEELNVDVENDDALCPVDLTRRHGGAFEALASSKIIAGDAPGEYKSYKLLKDDDKVNGMNTSRAESVCSDVSRSGSPRVSSPSVVSHQNRRLAFSVENILDPTKFTGRQGVYNDAICCWKPRSESLGSPEFDENETGKKQKSRIPE